MSDCIFCKIVRGEAPAEIVEIGRHSVTIVPLNPVVPGHTITIPFNHVQDAASSPGITADAMYEAAQIAKRHIASNIITSIGAPATQTVMHLHIHVVPRVEGDGLLLPWSNQHV
jgi:histidine triad (HIT) family protein